ncbi:MAG: hypothetical protein RB289_11415 [Paludibacter sp.]|jgi:hypothetical protein|nr:hypothetical protein [Paludibacter sp.]
MNTRKLLSWVALLGGEAIIVAAFVLFRGNLADNVLVLNIVVSSLIFGFLFVDILIPWVDLSDKTQKRVGSLGLRWFFSWLYALAAIALMLLANVAFAWVFTLQLILHSILIFMLTLGFVASFAASDKVEEVYGHEIMQRSAIEELKNAMRDLKNKLNELPGLPDSFVRRVETLDEGLRYIAPANSVEAYELEHAITQIVRDISYAVTDYALNEEAIDAYLRKAERTYQNRKSIYSN